MKRLPELIWQCRQRTLKVADRPLIMGILNVTPDSFSDGGIYKSSDEVRQRVDSMVEEGVDIVDIGGESSRPGAAPVSADEEWRRIETTLRYAVSLGPCVVSVDTTKAEVARRALDAGAHLVNDISAGTGDDAMLAAVAAAKAGIVLMHMRGTPQTMQQNPEYGNVMAEVVDFLQARRRAAHAAGIPDEAIALDPGIGFGKTVEHNLALLSGLPKLAALGRPVVVGLSRKSFLGTITGSPLDQRLAASLAGMTYSAMRGGNVFRVHDTKESCDVARLVAMLRREERG